MSRRPYTQRPSIQRFALAALKNAAAGYDLVRRPDPGLVILLYHRVGRRSTLKVDLPTWLFGEEMSRLGAGGGAVSLDEGLGLLEHTAGPSPQPVVITFDDGTADFVDEALPILVESRLPATLYLATDFIERGKSFPGGGEPASWAALADALATGLVTIGSHTHTHALLDRLAGPAVEDELERSVGLIGERLGVEARHFAYPKALAGSSAADAAVRRRFRSAALAGTRANSYGATDAYRLSRSPIQVDDGLRFFAHKVQGGLGLEDDVRRLVNRRRLIGATT